MSNFTAKRERVTITVGGNRRANNSLEDDWMNGPLGQNLVINDTLNSTRNKEIHFVAGKGASVSVAGQKCVGLHCI